MAREMAKSLSRRLRDPLFTRLVYRGTGLDIGAGVDGLSHWAYMLPGLTSVRDWDLEDGDAEYMTGVDEQYDVVNSSHCLEHMVAPLTALKRWWALVKPGGYLVILVPDEAMYEQGVWPSTFNTDHKWSYTLLGGGTLPKSLAMADLVKQLGPDADCIKLERLISGFKDGAPRQDQTAVWLVEAAIEAVIRKKV